MNVQQEVQKLHNRYQQRLNSEIRRLKKQALRKYERELDRQLNAVVNVNVTTDFPPQSKNKRINTGFTKPKDFESFVLKFLRENGGKATKKQIADAVVARMPLKSADFEIHPDGQARYYKSLCRTRKELEKKGFLKPCDECERGMWELA